MTYRCFYCCFCYSILICPKPKRQTIKMHIIKSQTAFSFTNSHICSEWKPFHELLPVLKNRGISIWSHGKVFLGLCQKCNSVWYWDMGITKRPDQATISWICDKPFPTLSKTSIIYFVKIVDIFGKKPLNFTFTKYGLVFMQNTVFWNVCRSLRHSWILIKFSTCI